MPTYGGTYRITGTYSGSGIKTTVATAYVYVTQNFRATLSVTNTNIGSGANNTGTADFKLNGNSKSSSLVT
jgi:hypothetical protein